MHTRNRADARRQVIDLLQGGRPIPKRSGNLAAKPTLDAPLARKARLQRLAARYRARIAKSDGGREIARALRELRDITDGVAKRKLALPAKRIEVPGILAGSYTLLMTPPYRAQQDTTNVSGNPDISANAYGETGQMVCRVVSNSEHASSGEADAYLALYFRPMFGPATLRIRPTMAIDFSWWVNSIGPVACSSAQGLMRVYLDGGFTEVARAAFLGWSVTKQHDLDFDFASTSGPSWSLDLPVDPSHLYQLVFVLKCSASANGWPGSLAGSVATVSIPSVSFEVDWMPLVMA